MNETAPAPQPNADLRAPRLIKRNMTLLALSQSFNGPGIQLAYGFGPLMVIALTGSASLLVASSCTVRARLSTIVVPLRPVT